MRGLLLSPLLLLLAALAVACGSDASPARDFDDAAREVAPSVLLRAEDLPGWSASGGGFAGGDLEFSPDCDVLDAERLLGDAAATRQSPVFEGPEERLALSLAAVYRTEEEASEAIADAEAMVDRCRDEYLETLDSVARSTLSDRGLGLGSLARINVSLEPLAFAARTEEHLGYRAQVRVSLVGFDTTYALDVLLLRQGRVVGTLVYAGFTPFDADRQALTDLIATRVSAAEEDMRS